MLMKFFNPTNSKNPGKKIPLGKGFFTFGVCFFILYLFSVIALFFNTGFSAIAIGNIIAVVIYLIFGILFVIIGKKRRKNLYYYKNEVTPPTQFGKEYFSFFRFFFIAVSSLTLIFSVIQFILFIPGFKDTLIYPSTEVKFFSVISRILLILGTAFWSIYFIAFFGKFQSPLFASGIILIALSDISDLFLIVYRFYFYSFGKEIGKSYFSNEFENLGIQGICYYAFLFISPILLCLTVFNIKTAFKKSLKNTIVVCLSFCAVYNIYLTYSNLYYCIKYRAPQQFFYIVNAIIYLICIIMQTMYENYYYIQVYSNKKDKLLYKLDKNIDIQVNTSIQEVPILFCRKCGSSLEANSLFCKKCGTKIISKSESIIPNVSLVQKSVVQNIKQEHSKIWRFVFILLSSIILLTLLLSISISIVFSLNGVFQ